MDWHARGRFVYDELRKTADESQAQAKRMLDAAGLDYVSFFTTNALYVRGGAAVLVRSLATLSDVTAVAVPRTYAIDPPVIDESVEAGTHTAGALAWGIVDTGADQFWQSFGTGSGIVVANIDTGVQWNHPALAGAYRCGSNPSDAACWSDPANICGSGGACDNNGHGTHVMGTMVGDNNPALTWQAGMAPGATWIACKGCESNSCSDFALNSCADWIIAPGGDPDNRPHVVNNSWGGGGGDNWYLAKVNAWRAAGIFPAFSAGNMGEYGCATIGSPGDYQESFATAAHDSSGTIAYFSSRGPSAFGATPYTKPNISAPGVNVCSSLPGDAWSCDYSGTSMASPHTAGAVALLWACSPDLRGDIDATIQVLQGTAGTTAAGNCGAPPSAQGNYTYGYGHLDVLAAGAQYCESCDLIVTHKKIRSDKLKKDKKVVLKVTSEDDVLNISDTIDLGVFTLYKDKVKYIQKKNLFKIKVTVPAGLAPGAYPIRVGDCSGEVVIVSE
jgi:subtilisin family serine protease